MFNTVLKNLISVHIKFIQYISIHLFQLRCSIRQRNILKTSFFTVHIFSFRKENNLSVDKFLLFASYCTKKSSIVVMIIFFNRGD
jgi:hypothetical protein